MRRCLLLVVTAAAFATISALAVVTGDQHRRSLRGDTDVPVTHNKDGNVKQRTGGSSLLYKMKKNAQVTWWLEAGKSDDYVRGALKLKGLKGDALKSHKNYRYYAHFVKKSEEYQLNKWLTRDVTTYMAWEMLGFQQITKADELPLIKMTDEFRLYKRYVNDFDTYALRTMKAGYEPPRVMVSRGATDAEMTARTLIMAEAGRSDAYAKLALGMTEGYNRMKVLKCAALEGQKDFNYFLLFVREREPAMRDELARLEKLAKLSKRQRKAQREMLDDLKLIEKYRQRNGGAQ